MNNRIRKYILIVVLFLTSLLCAVGASTWIILSEQTAAPSTFNKINTEIVSVSIADTNKRIYYGEEIKASELSFKIQTKDDSKTDISTFFEVDSFSTTSVTASGNSTSLTGTTSVSFKLKSNYADAYNLPTATTVNVPMHAVASYNQSTYYTTVDQALAAANAADSGTVYALPLGTLATTTANDLDTGRAKKAKTIGITNTTTATTEIKSGVTFRLPFTTTDDTKTTDVTETIDTELAKIMYNVYQKNASAYGVTKYLQNQVFVKNSYTLTNEGTISIAGQVSGGDATNTLSSMTAGNHAQINLNANSKISNIGIISCYGYINDLSDNNTANVESQSGTVNVVFSVVEHRGGAYYFGMLNPDEPTVNADGTVTYSFNKTVKDEIVGKALSGVFGGSDYTPTTLQCPPFNRFYVENINCKFINRYNSNVVAFADLYADNKHNETNITLISSQTSEKNPTLILLTSSSSYVENQFDTSNKKHTLNIYGSMKLNPLSLSLYVEKSVAKINIHLTTSNVFFPISNHFDIILNPVNANTAATVDLTAQKVKLLPGASLTIKKGVTVDTNYLAIYTENTKLNGNYEDFDSPYSTNDLERPYTNNTPASLIVNGTLNAANIGGNIQTNQSSGIINITTNTVISKEMKSRAATQNVELISGVPLPYAPIYYYTDAECTLTANGKTLNSDNATLNAGTYYSNGRSWYTVGYKVSLNANGGKFSDNTTQKDNTVTAEMLNGSNGGYVVNLPTTERTHYTFSHWCENQNCANGDSCEDKFVSGTAVYKDTTLYAHWNVITYTIEYVVTNNTSAYKNLNETTLQAGVTESITLYTDGEHVIDSEELFFKGWYLDSALSANKKITSVSLNDIASGKVTLSNNYTITLYGTFLSGYPVKFYINDTDVQTALGAAYADGIYNESTVTPTDLIPDTDLNALDMDTVENQAVTKYFIGWYLDSACTQAFDVDTFDPTSVTGELSLYAKWADKSVVTLTSTDTNYPISTTDTFYYKPNYEFKITVGETAYDSNTDKANYFDGWTYNGKTYQVGDTLELTETSGVTFAAVWSPKLQVTVANSTTINTTVFATTTYHVKPNDKFEVSVAALNAYTIDKTTLSQEYYFGGWKITDETSADIGEQANLTISIDKVDSSCTYTVQWADKYKLSFNTTTNNGNVDVSLTEVYLIDEQEFDLTTTNEYLAKLDDYDDDPHYNKYFDGWVNIDTDTLTIDTDTEITVYWGDKYSITATSISNATIKIGDTTLEENKEYWYKSGFITFGVTFSNKNDQTFKIDGETKTLTNNGSYPHELESDIKVEASSSGCIVEGTLITLVDGTKKPIENVTASDKVLIFNHLTGKMEPGQILFTSHGTEESNLYRIVNLQFSDGTTLRIVQSHGLFDLDLNKYVYLKENNYNDYIGHRFYKSEFNGTEFVGGEITLINAFITEEVVRIFCPVTAFHMNCFAESLLTMPNIPYNEEGLVNFFEFGDGLKYDEEKMQADIEKYGLYSYEDFAEYFSYEAFIASPAVYLKISIGKGLITFDEILLIIDYLLNGNYIS